MSGAVEGVALLPCPFCGGRASLERNPHVNGGLICEMVVCDNDCVATFFYETEAKATAAWNTRTTPPARSYADGVEDEAFAHLANVLFADPGPKEIAARKAATDWWHQQDAAIRLLSQGGKA